MSPCTVASTPNLALQVMIDKQGLMKVTHMMNLAGSARPTGGTYQGMAAYAESQRSANANVGIVRYICAPEEPGGDDGAEYN